MSDEPIHLDDEYGERTLRELRTDGPLLLYTRDLASVSLEGWYTGRSCFLLGAGPSLGKLNLSLLRKRGIVTMAMNNAWVVYRPNLWVGLDHPQFFPDGGWRDPGVTKFCPLSSLGKRLRERKLDGSVGPSQSHVRDMPAVWGFRRCRGFTPSEFLHGGSIAWGSAPEADSLGIRAGGTTMLAAVRLLAYLGFGRVYLAGCDFKMATDATYAHGQERTERQVARANYNFGAMNERLTALVPYLELAGVRMFNTTEGSGLTAFPHMPFTEAVAEATRECAMPMSLKDWNPQPPEPVHGTPPKL